MTTKTPLTDKNQANTTDDGEEFQHAQEHVDNAHDTSTLEFNQANTQFLPTLPTMFNVL